MQSPAGQAEWKVAGSDQGSQSTHPRQRQAPLSCPEATARLSKDQAAWREEQLQGQRDWSADETVPRMALHADPGDNLLIRSALFVFDR